MLIRLGDRAEQFFALFGDTEGRVGFKGHTAFFEEHQELYDDVQRALELLATHLQLVKNAPEEVIPLFRRAQETRVTRLAFWTRGDDRTYRLLDRTARPRLLPASHADRRVGDPAREAFRHARYRGADLGDAGGGRHVRVRRETAGNPGRAAADRSQPLRLPETGAALRAAAHARSAIAGVSARRGRGDHAHSEAQPRPGLRTVHQLPADAHGLRSGFARDRLSRRCCRAPDRAARCWKSFALRRTACSSRPRLSGRAWTCRAIN